MITPFNRFIVGKNRPQKPISRSIKTVATGKVAQLTQLELITPKNPIRYDLFTFSVVTGVAALPLTNRGFMLVKHYQAGTDRLELCLPAGGLEADEKPEARMQQELKEEIGYQSGKLTLVTRAAVLPGYIGVTDGYLYIAEELTPAASDGDEDFQIEVCEYTFNQLQPLLLSGEVRDIRTLLLLYWLENNHLKTGSYGTIA